jgi:hypothetical protein
MSIEHPASGVKDAKRERLPLLRSSLLPRRLSNDVH